MVKHSDDLLFSEGQVSALVEARISQFRAEMNLIDEVPKTIIINRKLAISKLKEMEKEIRDKHSQATMGWKKAFRLYMQHIQKNPGSKAINDPGSIPKLGTRVDGILALIRTLEIVPDSTIKLARTEWKQLFSEGSQAISEMRAKRDEYYATVSGVIASSNSNTR